MKYHLISFAIGLLAGLFGGLIGLGGGLVMIPLLVGLLRLDQCRAHGTSLAVLIFTGISGAITYGYHGNINLTAATALAVPAVITVAAGARFADALPDWKLKRFFGFFLIFCSALLLLRPFFPDVIGALPAHLIIASLAVTGAFTGFLSGLIGVGGGTIMIPAMILLAGFSQHLSQGTALLVMVPTGCIGAYAHWKLGNVEGDLLFGMVPGIFIGTFLGSSIAHVIPEDPLRWLFVFVAVYIGWRYVKVVQPGPCDNEKQ